MRNIIFFSYAAAGKGISGGDRIFMEFARRWSKKDLIKIYLWTEGYEMTQRQHLANKNISYIISTMNPWYKFGFVINYLARIINSVIVSFQLQIKDPQNAIVYSSSEFWMDVFPSVIVKLRYPTVTYVATWYQTAPNPLIGFTYGKREQTFRFRALLYWLAQLPIKPLINAYADHILVNNEDERKQFPKQNKEKKVHVVIGAVDTNLIDQYKKTFKSSQKKFDAVFQGRFHPQKGVTEAVQIWKKVTKKIPSAILVMIGDGPLMKSVQEKVNDLHLGKSIILTGYLFDGEEKYQYFNQSKLVIHPAFYDSGGMAAAEAMAFGIPAVGFNLKAFESYYPKGMEKVTVGEIESFAQKIIDLLKNSEKRKILGKEAQILIYNKYSWDQRAKQIYSLII